MPHLENCFLSAVDNDKFSLNKCYFPYSQHFTGIRTVLSNLANQLITHFYIKLVLLLLLITLVFLLLPLPYQNPVAILQEGIAWL